MKTKKNITKERSTNIELITTGYFKNFIVIDVKWSKNDIKNILSFS